MERLNPEPLLPRNWWNDPAARLHDLAAARELLDREERAWNAMVGFWRRQGGPGEPPPVSPPFHSGKYEETIIEFP